MINYYLFINKISNTMALHVPKAPGMAQMLKEGARVRKQQFLHFKSHVVSCVGDYFNSVLF